MFVSQQWPRVVAATMIVCACFDAPTVPDFDGSTSRADAGSAVFPPTSRSSSIAVSRRPSYRVAINPDLSQLLITGSMGSWAADVLPPNSQPWSIATDATGTTAFVTLRKTRELARIDGLPYSAHLTWRTPVCSEPTGVALAPNGSVAVVACFGEPAAVIVDTVDRAKTWRVPLDGVARAVAVSNDGDADDSDEHAYVTLFYGAPTLEGSDAGRVGRVVRIDLRSRAASGTIWLGPISDTGFGPPLPNGGEGSHVGCAPNQLAAIAIAGNRAFVVHTCVSPQPPLNKLTTLFSAVSVLDLDRLVELESVAIGSLVRRTTAAPDSLLGVLVDIDVDAEGRRAVVLSQAANRVAMLSVAPGAKVALELSNGSTSATAAPRGCSGYPTCGGAGGGPSGVGSPIGVPIGAALVPEGVVVNDWTGRSVQVVHTASGFVEIAGSFPPALAPDTRALLLGRFFFYTAQDRWSFRDVGSCASCHPDGLSDNVTWMFPAGPRQTPSLDGTFAKNDALDHRAQNWTAIFDEIYDVEGVTRNLLGGKGAITDRNDTPIPLSSGVVFANGLITRNDNLSGSSRSLVDEMSNVKDWHEIELFIQQVHAMQAPLGLDPTAAARGRAVFLAGGCPSCHGGAKWTVSRVPYTPSPEKNGSLVGDNGLPVAASGLRNELRDGGELALNRDTLKVAPERVSNPDGGATPLTIGPERITCAVRDVGTFDAKDPLEKKTDGTFAQGAMGFNPPSLFGLGTSAPYFHHGAATTLADVFNPKFAAHTRAGAPGFSPRSDEVRDLVEFLRSIDESTAPFPNFMTQDICGGY